jgi:hypothetical protein
MTHTVNGKQTTKGMTIHYIDQNGARHQGVIDEVQDNGSADLTVNVGGQQRTFENVPHSAGGGTHTWDHTQAGHTPAGGHSQAGQHPQSGRTPGA